MQDNLQIGGVDGIPAPAAQRHDKTRSELSPPLTDMRGSAAMVKPI